MPPIEVVAVDTYSVLRDEWKTRYTGTFKGPNGKTRDCGHKHTTPELADECATARRNRIYRETPPDRPGAHRKENRDH